MILHRRQPGRVEFAQRALADASPNWRKLINLRGLESLRLRSAPQPSAGGSPVSA